MKTAPHYLLICCLGLCLNMTGSNPTHAGFLTTHSGSTVYGEQQNGVLSQTADTTVSFSVYQNNGTTGNWVTDLNLTTVLQSLLGSPGSIDETATYVYFYQVSNTDPVPVDDSVYGKITQFRVFVGEPGNVTSTGYLSQTAFTESGVSLSSTNNALGTNTTSPDTVDNPGDNTPTQTGVVNVGLQTGVSSAMYNPVSGELLASDLAPMSGADVVYQFSPTIAAGGLSTVFFFTSNTAPRFSLSGTRDGVQALGDTATPTPVPAGLALLLTGLPGCAWLVRSGRRRRQGETEVAA